MTRGVAAAGPRYETNKRGEEGLVVLFLRPLRRARLMWETCVDSDLSNATSTPYNHHPCCRYATKQLIIRPRTSRTGNFYFDKQLACVNWFDQILPRRNDECFNNDWIALRRPLPSQSAVMRYTVRRPGTSATTRPTCPLRWANVSPVRWSSTSSGWRT